jgi:helicase
MKLSDLEKEGIPRRIIDLWRDRQGETLLPVQRSALKSGLLADARHHQLNVAANDRNSESGNLLVAAPTSSGKSFCAEMAAIKAVAQRQKAVLLYPLKSLLEQNARLFRRTYQAEGIKCLVSSADHPENDLAFSHGDFHIALSIYEKFDQVLTGNLDLLSNIGLIVIDELQTISEPRRGAVLERLLTKILASDYHPRLVGLSAALDETSCARLGDWLSARVLREQHRPVDLLRGVAAAGTVRFRSYNSTIDQQEPFELPQVDSEDAAGSLIEYLKNQNCPALVFLKSRQDTVRFAFRLAAAVRWSPAAVALERLHHEEPSFLTRSLIQALNRGVAFHNSDLTPKQRGIIEDSFVSKEIRVLCSTTTLALGVNLPADIVYLETVKYAPASYDHRPVLLPISRGEFENMTGRAGRLGANGDVPGKAVVLADSEFERDVLWDNYIVPDEPEPLRSVFGSMPLEDWILNIVASGLAENTESIVRVLSHSFWSCQSQDVPTPNLKDALEKLSAAGLVKWPDHDSVKPTAVGREATCSGLSTCQAEHLLAAYDEHHTDTAPGLLALALSTPEWELPPGFLTRTEVIRSALLQAAYERFGHSLSDLTPVLPSRQLDVPLEFRTTANLKALMLLDDWRQMIAVRKLEERYQIHLGQITTLGQTIGHLLSSLANLVAARNGAGETIKKIQTVAFAVRYGLDPALREIHYLLRDDISRSDYAALFQAHVVSARSMTAIAGPELARILGSESKAAGITDKLQTHIEEVEMQSVGRHDFRMTPSEPELIEIDGEFDRERYLVKIDGRPVRLTGKSFKYFTKLAWSRLNGDGGWIYKEDIEVGFNQARYLYRMKNEIATGFHSNWSILENNRLGYYRLNVDPQKIRINCDRLKSHPDWEVRQLFDESQAVN